MAAQLSSPIVLDQVNPFVPLQWLRVSRLPARLITRLLSVVISLMLLTMASAAMALLAEGDSGDAVRDLQNRLAVEQCYNGPISGYFGSLTQQGVIACQQKFGLTPDGVVGPKTMAVLDGMVGLGPNANPNQTTVAKSNPDELQQGSRGDRVIALQQQLQALNLYNGSIDGDFGPMTEAALVQFQRSYGLVQTGVFGQLERQVIATAQPEQRQPGIGGPADSVIKRNQLTLGDAGEDVKLLQARLRELRHFDSAPTGYFGDVTKYAVKSFQTASSIAPSGVADTTTLRALGLSGLLQASRSGAAAADKTQAFNTAGFTNNSGSFTNNSGGFTNNSSGFTSTATTPDANGGSRFVVIIPKREGVSLNQVRKLVPDAIEGKSNIGTFIQTGTFTDQKTAERQSQMLQAYRLDARVAYR